MKEVKGKTLHSAPSVASVIISCFLAKRLYTGALRGLTFTGAALTLSVPSVLTAVSVMHALCGRSLLLGGRGVGGSRKAGGVLRSTTGARCHFLCVTCCCGWGSLVGRENGGGGHFVDVWPTAQNCSPLSHGVRSSASADRLHIHPR